MVLWFPEEIPPAKDDVDQLGSWMAAPSTERSILPELLHEIERRWVPLGTHFPPNSVTAFLKKLPPAVTDVEGISWVFLMPPLLSLAISHCDTVQLPSLQSIGEMSCFMSTIFTKIFTTEKPGSCLLNKDECSCKSGWKEMKLLVPKQKLMQTPWLFHYFNNTEKIWLMHTAMLEWVHQPPAHFLTI